MKLQAFFVILSLVTCAQADTIATKQISAAEVRAPITKKRGDLKVAGSADVAASLQVETTPEGTIRIHGKVTNSGTLLCKATDGYTLNATIYMYHWYAPYTPPTGTCDTIVHQDLGPKLGAGKSREVDTTYVVKDFIRWGTAVQTSNEVVAHRTVCLRVLAEKNGVTNFLNHPLDGNDANDTANFELTYVEKKP